MLKKILYAIRSNLYNKYLVNSYSQEGEDLVLSRIFSHKDKGFYVDVGAHHPMRFSNTYKFYNLGWQGINIEPNPDSFHLFKKYRPKDINLNYGVACKKGDFEYFMFDESALNTFDINVFNDRIANTPYKHLKTIKIEIMPLAELLKNELPGNTKIDFLSIDVEGLDLQVLQSNDWDIYRPKWVLAEQLNLANIENLDFELHHYMHSLNYELFSKTYNTLFYKDKSI